MNHTLRTYCSGGDLFGVGAAAAGWTVVDGYEISDRIAAVARLNGHNVHTADVLRLDYGTLPPVVHEHWSPPCISASQANSNQGETPLDIALAEACIASIAAHAARGGTSWSLENVWGYTAFTNCFPPILQALKRAGFQYRFRHINMADYGVPQTRKRLIVWATRGRPVPELHPTHQEQPAGGWWDLPRWVGWYEAIADLLPTCPLTQPAPWQVQRLARMAKLSTVLVGGGNTNISNPATMPRDVDSPAFTLMSVRASTVRVFLVGGGNTNLSNPTSLPRAADAPAFTMRGEGGSPDRVVLLGDQSARSGAGVLMREAGEPSMVLRGGRDETYRAGSFGGEWRALTVPCLGRLQTVPDTYKGLTKQTNGNGVPCRFSRLLMEALTQGGA